MLWCGGRNLWYEYGNHQKKKKVPGYSAYELLVLSGPFNVIFHPFVLGMCNPKNYSDSPATSKSTVEELHRPIPSLFRALTEGDAPINMMVVSFPVAEELSHHENLVSFLESLDNRQQNVSVPGNSIHASYDTQGNMNKYLTICTFCTSTDCIQKTGWTSIENAAVSRKTSGKNIVEKKKLWTNQEISSLLL